VALTTRIAASGDENVRYEAKENSTF